MRKILFIISILLFSFKSFSNNNEEIFKSIMRDLDNVGENIEKEPNKEDILIENITSLLGWNFSPQSNEKVKLTSGVFAMIGMKKVIFNDKNEKRLYKKNFEAIGFGSSFLYKNYIVTNFHMCRGLNTIIRDYNNNIYGVKVLAYDVNQDICILKAPKGVMDQRNFYSYKKESLNNLKVTQKIISKKIENNKEIMPNDAVVSGAYGEFNISEIGKDLTDDIWTKKFSYTAYGSKCKGGVSGSPVVSKSGIIGLFWGAGQLPNDSYLFDKEKRTPSNIQYKEPACYFIDIKEVDRVINTIK